MKATLLGLKRPLLDLKRALLDLFEAKQNSIKPHVRPISNIIDCEDLFLNIVVDPKDPNSLPTSHRDFGRQFYQFYFLRQHRKLDIHEDAQNRSKLAEFCASTLSSLDE